MGFHGRPGLDPLVLLVCDECDCVLAVDGRRSIRFRETAGDNLVAHFGARDELAMRAVQAGWRARIGAHYERAYWVCPSCAAAEDTARWRLVPHKAP